MNHEEYWDLNYLSLFPSNEVRKMGSDRKGGVSNVLGVCIFNEGWGSEKFWGLTDFFRNFRRPRNLFPEIFLFFSFFWGDGRGHDFFFQNFWGQRIFSMKIWGPRKFSQIFGRPRYFLPKFLP